VTEPLVRYAELPDCAGVACLTFSRPEAGNAITPGFTDDLAEAVNWATTAGCRAVLLCAEGPNFCVGADLKHFAAMSDGVGEELRRMAEAFHAVLARLTELQLPVVARVQGAAVGAGLGLMLAADYVVCASDARLSTGYAKLGLSADAGVSFFLTQALGPRLARRLLMTACFVSASEAAAWGLVDECCAPGELVGVANAVAARFAQGPTRAYGAIKRLTQEAGRARDLRAHLDRERDEIVALADNEQLARAIAAINRSGPAKGGAVNGRDG
jgi:2-(1,2-epoxy-1,2-dihydrophenyl)acetyl-CoA isomerase